MDPLSLFASIVWGSVGLGFLIYGRKRRRPVPAIGGIALMAVSYFMKPMALSLAGISIITAIYYLSKRM